MFSLPIRVVGKERPRVNKGRAHTPKRTRDCERLIALGAQAQGVRPLDGPAAIRIEFRYRTRVVPDLDNAIKTVLDGLNGVAWQDDKQVAHVDATRIDACSDDSVTVQILPFLLAR